jgi:DNA-binding transcriptional LysR family regulator
MDHRQLLNFLSVCEEKSFSNAARHCFITHQGLSKSIRLLEDEFDVPLFVRTSVGIETTEFGKALQDAILPYMSQYDKIMDTMRRLKDRGGHFLSIGMLNGYHKCLPPQFFNLFMDKNPDISIDIISFNDELSQQSMLDYNINIGFVGAPVNENLFESLLFRRIKVGLVMGEKHHLSKRGSIKLHELRGEQIIVLNGNRNLINFCRRNDIRPRMRLNLAELDLVSELCVFGRVACLMGKLVNFTGLNYIDIEDSDLYIENHLVVNRNRHKSAAVEKFIAYAREQLPDWNLQETPHKAEQIAD